MTKNVISVIKERAGKPLEEFLFAFIQRTEDPLLTQKMAKLLLMLAGDVAISSVVQIRYQYHLLQACNAVRNGENMK